MQHHSQQNTLLGVIKGSLVAFLITVVFTSCSNQEKTIVADEDNAGLTLPEGFGALKAADSVGKPRHLTVNAHGDIFVKLERPKDGKGILVLSDTDGDGKIDSTAGFGDYGGTGIAIKGDYLYASSNTDVFRYKLDENERVADTQPETVITGLIDRRQHNSKSIALDDAGNIYVNIGAYSNACQIQDRTKGSPGMLPCPVLDSAGGIWQFKADGNKQGYSNGVHYATGLRNVVGLDWNKQANALFVMQHGRDNLQDFYPELFGGPDVSVNLPAETMYEVRKGTNAGWPYYFYDQNKKQKVVNPEYESHQNDLIAADSIADPAVAFPAHLAPNALLFYTGDMFPEKYKNGAFIAFHGSWNRAPKQEGFMVAFVPFKDGKPNGEWEVFAKGFAGADTIESPGDAKHRPTGLAQGPDGSLYVSDDAGGTIYRIIYAKK